MPSTTDKKSRPHNKIPSEGATNRQGSNGIDAHGWQEHVAVTGTDDADRLFPHVRYGFAEDDGLRQEGLVPLNDPIPGSATTVSAGIYFLTPEETARISRGIRPRQIQTACEDAGRVAYTVVAESDAMEEGESVPTIIDWLTTLATGHLGIEGSEYRLFFSGNRSIHLHTDYFIRHQDLSRLKDDIESFNETEDAALDLSIYSPKKQFRLTGAKHTKTDLYKIQIPEHADRSTIIPKAQDPDELALPHSIPRGGMVNLVAGTIGRSSLPQEFEHRLLPEYIKAASSDTEQDSFADLDGSYNNRHFSPYAKTGDGERSICVFEPKGGAFCRRDEKKIYLPSHIYGSRGADGEYVIRDRKAPVLLSKDDYDKREFETGETLVIIGGRSRKSRIFEIDEFDRELISNQLNLPDHDDQRQLVFTWLEAQGYPVGESGMHGEPRESASGASAKIQQLKQTLIQVDRTPKRQEAFSVSCSILQTDGYKEAWEWNKRAWGDQFDPKITRDNLQNIVEQYPGDYEHINIK